MSGYSADEISGSGYSVDDNIKIQTNDDNDTLQEDSGSSADSSHEEEEAIDLRRASRVDVQTFLSLEDKLALKKNDSSESSTDDFELEAQPDSKLAQKLEDRSWNEEFQKLLSMSEGEKKWKALSRLGKDFVYCSKTYGKIIITEYHLPDDKKTIPPEKSLGGVAGGEKYLCAGIFFKFALDIELSKGKWMYGGENGRFDHGAMKAARNDMIGLLSYYNSGVEGLHYPLMSQIDYRGYRLVAISNLPIKGSRTLIYGSADKGETVRNSPEIRDKMRAVGELLNLKGHRIAKSNEILYGPGDIEGHKGMDRKFYVLDFARVFPPEAPKYQDRSQYYCLLRPEFVRNYKIPLSSDAFTKFGEQDNLINNQEIIQATNYLYQFVIPNFIKILYSYDYESDWISFRITEKLHRNGINCRQLGLIRSAVRPNHPLGKLLLSEMLARTLIYLFRHTLRVKMESLKVAKEEPYINKTFHFLDAILASTIPIPPNQGQQDVKIITDKLPDGFIKYPTVSRMKEIEFWSVDIKYHIQAKYRRALKPEEFREYDIRNEINMYYLLIRFSQLAGIKLSKHALTEYKQNLSNGKHFFKLMKNDIRKLSARVRHLNVIDEAEANLLVQEAKHRAKIYGEVRTSLWEIIDKKFASAVASNTNNVNTFIRWGDMLYTQCSLTTPSSSNVNELMKLLQQSEEKYRSAEILNGNLWEINYQIALIFIFKGVILRLIKDTTAESHWQFTLSSLEFQKVFSKYPLATNKIITQARELFEEAKQQKQTAKDQEKTEFLLLQAYYILYCSFKVSEVPNAFSYYLSACILLEYIRIATINKSNNPKQLKSTLSSSLPKQHLPTPLTASLSANSSTNSNNTRSRTKSVASDRPNIPSRPKTQSTNNVSKHFYAAAGSMFECAFLLTPTASDKNFTYVIKNLHAPHFRNIKNLNLIIDVFRKHEGGLCDLVSIFNANPIVPILYFIPFIFSNDLAKDYEEGRFFADLHELLIANKLKKPIDCKKDTIILHHHSFNKFILSAMDIMTPPSSPKIRIHLLGSFDPILNIDLAEIQSLRCSNLVKLPTTPKKDLSQSNNLPPGSPPSPVQSDNAENSNNNQNYHHICSFDIEPGVFTNFPIVNHSPSTFLFLSLNIHFFFIFFIFFYFFFFLFIFFSSFFFSFFTDTAGQQREMGLVHFQGMINE